MFKKEVKKEQDEPFIKKIISYILSIICLSLCLYIVVEVINANTHQRPPRIFGVSVSYVPTGSMEPVIHSGDYIMFVPTTFDKVEVDDIIVYYNEEEAKYIVHRIIEKDEVNQVLTCKGDANKIADTKGVTPSMIYGKYVTTLGFMAIFSGGINQNLIFFILVAIFVIMIGMQVVSVVVKAKAEKIKEDAEKEHDLMKEELKKQIMEEEMKKLKEELRQEMLKNQKADSDSKNE